VSWPSPCETNSIGANSRTRRHSAQHHLISLHFKNCTRACWRSMPNAPQRTGSRDGISRVSIPPPDSVQGGGNSSNSGADYVFLISRRPEQYRGLHLAIRIRDQRTHQRIRRWREWVIKSHRYRLRGKVVARKEEFVAGRVDGYLLVENGRVLQSM